MPTTANRPSLKQLHPMPYRLNVVDLDLCQISTHVSPSAVPPMDPLLNVNNKCRIPVMRIHHNTCRVRTQMRPAIQLSSMHIARLCPHFSMIDVHLHLEASGITGEGEAANCTLISQSVGCSFIERSWRFWITWLPLNR